jgi:transcriptional regulator with XRE-family HTH domain
VLAPITTRGLSTWTNRCSSGKTPYLISKETGVSQGILSRFLNDERDLKLSTADKLAELLEIGIGIGFE